MKNRMNNNGFSLVELIVVIAIMAILVGVLAPSVLGQIDKAKQAKDKQAIDSIASAVAIAWADQDLNADKPTAGGAISIGVTVTDKAGKSTPAGTPNSTFVGAIQNMVGWTEVQMESNMYKKNPSIKTEVNATTGKVTVTLTADGAKPYVITK